MVTCPIFMDVLQIIKKLAEDIANQGIEDGQTNITTQEQGQRSEQDRSTPQQYLETSVAMKWIFVIALHFILYKHLFCFYCYAAYMGKMTCVVQTEHGKSSFRGRYISDVCGEDARAACSPVYKKHNKKGIDNPVEGILSDHDRHFPT